MAITTGKGGSQMGRKQAIQAFLDQTAWADAAVQPLAADASFRVYHRIVGGPERAVLMDAPPGKEDVRPFAKIAEHLLRLGYSAPRILARDNAQGFLLLEDLGDDTVTRLLKQGADETGLYDLATDVLVDLHAKPSSLVYLADLPAYDEATLMREALLFPDWYLPAVAGQPTPDHQRNDFIAAWAPLFKAVQGGTNTLVLRDYHVDNILRLGDRPGIKAMGLLDFQDALIGHPAYDLMSLLEDARRDINPALIDRELARYRDGLQISDWDDFMAAYAILGAGRHAKVIGIFTRLSVRDGKPHYLDHISRVWGLLERSLHHPKLKPVQDWFNRYVPKDLRCRPESPSPRHE